MINRALAICGAIVLGTIAIDGQVRKSEIKALDSKEAIARGDAVFKGHCAICHFAASAEKKIGPGLKGLPKLEKFADGTKNDSQNLTRLIQNGGKNMPPLRTELSDAQIRDLLAYLRTL